MATPPTYANNENKSQKCNRYSYSSLEKPGFLWVHFGSGSSPTKAGNKKTKPLKDMKRFTVEKKTTKAEITPKVTNSRFNSRKSAIPRPKPLDAKKEKLLKSLGKRSNVRESERKVLSFSKKRLNSGNGKERSAHVKSDVAKEDARFPGLQYSKGGGITAAKFGNKKKDNAPPQKPQRAKKSVRDLNKPSRRDDEMALPVGDKPRDFPENGGKIPEDDNDQQHPDTSESSLLGAGDLKLTVERKANPEISIKIKVSDTSPKRAGKGDAKPSEGKKLTGSDLNDLSESGYSSVKDSSGYVSTVESIHNNRRNITIDLGHTKAKIDTMVNFSSEKPSDDTTALLVRGTQITKESKISMQKKNKISEESPGLKSQTSTHSVVIDVNADFPAQQVYHHDNVHQITQGKRDVDSKTVAPCPLDNMDLSQLYSEDEGDREETKRDNVGGVIQWPSEEDPTDLPTTLDNLIESSETPTRSVTSTESITNVQLQESVPLDDADSVKQDHSDSTKMSFPESSSLEHEEVSKTDSSQMLPPNVKRKSVPKFPSRIPPPRTYSESSLQSLLTRRDKQPQAQSRSMPSLHEKQVGKGYRSYKLTERHRQSGMKEVRAHQAEDKVLRFPAIQPSRSHSRDPGKIPVVSFQPESSSRYVSMPRIAVDGHHQTGRGGKGAQDASPPPGQYLKLPILQQPVRCKCTIVPHEELDQRRTKSAVECIANVHFLTDEELARFEGRSKTSHRRILRREEVARPGYHPMRYKALRTQTLKFLRPGQSTRDRQPMITFHVDHDKERNTFKLPTSKLNENKKWQVVFTLSKNEDATEKHEDAAEK